MDRKSVCGLTGFWTTEGLNDAELQQQIQRMTASIIHRGPDDQQTWQAPEHGLALGFRRLAILDLTAEGRQPMHSASGRYVIAFNGEIYNFQDLRVELLPHGHVFRGTSDTEVILAAFEQWGIQTAIKKFNGMFAFALWDRKTQTLTLARDRLGIKPLYYGWSGNTFLFGSELKSLRECDLFEAHVDRDAVAVFMRHNYIPAPYSIYRGISKLMPGTTLTVTAPIQHSDPVAYWSADETVLSGLANPYQGNEQDAVLELETLLMDAVARRMIADVPLGAFLSGGIDSPIVVALMQAQSPRPVKTFSIGFAESDYNEAGYAGRIAQRLGTEHTALYVTPGEAQAVIPLLGSMYDEPFADSSQIPTYLVSKLAREQVTVSLSGDGGDELFGGYNRYFWGRTIWNRIGFIPAGLRTAMRRIVTTLPVGGWQCVGDLMRPLLPTSYRQPYFGDKMHKLAGVLDSNSPDELYRCLVSHWRPSDALVQGSVELPTRLTSMSEVAIDDFSERMMYLDLVSYLPDDILVKVDRASMAVSLEARVPLLDHRVVEFAWRLPLEMKLGARSGKRPLRMIRDKYLPAEENDRAKMGFAIPIDEWLRGPLREWADDLLSTELLKSQGYLNPAPIQQKWREHLSGRRNWQYLLWDVLMFQSWLQG